VDPVPNRLLLPFAREGGQGEPNRVASDDFSQRLKTFTQHGGGIASYVDDNFINIGPVACFKRIKEVETIHLYRPAKTLSRLSLGEWWTDFGENVRHALAAGIAQGSF